MKKTFSLRLLLSVAAATGVTAVCASASALDTTQQEVTPESQSTTGVTVVASAEGSIPTSIVDASQTVAAIVEQAQTEVSVVDVASEGVVVAPVAVLDATPVVAVGVSNPAEQLADVVVTVVPAENVAVVAAVVERAQTEVSVIDVASEGVVVAPVAVLDATPVVTTEISTPAGQPADVVVTVVPAIVEQAQTEVPLEATQQDVDNSVNKTVSSTQTQQQITATNGVIAHLSEYKWYYAGGVALAGIGFYAVYKWVTEGQAKRKAAKERVTQRLRAISKKA